MIIDKRIIGVAMATSKDEIRPVLASVKFKDGKQIGTDGFYMLMIQEKNVDKADIPIIEDKKYEPVEEAMIPAKELIAFAKKIKKSNTLPILENAWTIPTEEGSIKLITTDLDNSSYLQTRKVAGEYPNVDKIIDEAKAKKPVIEINFSPKKMRELLQAMEKAGLDQGYSMVTMQLTGVNDAIVLTGNDSEKREVFGMLMPMKK